MDGVQTEMLQRMTRVETKVDNMDEKLDRAITANETAVEALQSAKSAHHRLDKIEDGQKWLWRTISGTIITAVIAALFALLKTTGV
ncbi:hemolysin XhlA family protein [Paenibacillus polymyxa]|uniref:hemolysin XhlA family protein n=1 Tax=Paenibacillus polymyxa TaxID=1406 RepID=UPI002024BE17|nr:hemolysin XhlA family protein [Paenibacillus polymyxa]URJ42217.1 hemolysin XhlA family protein [Paenibacillus polymyxa]